MKYIVTLLCLYMSMVNAVKYYGFVPTPEQHDVLEKSMTDFDYGDREIVSMLGTSNKTGQEVFDFLGSYGIYNRTLEDLFTSSTDETGIEKRNPVAKVICDKRGKVTDRLGESVTNHLCNGLAAVLTGAYDTIAAVVHSKKCNERSTGHPTACTALVVFVATSGTAFIPLEFKPACPYFLNIFDTECDSAEGEIVAKSRDLKVLKQTGQKDVTCDMIEVPCTEANEG